MDIKRIIGSIIPTDVKIYYENKIPYIDYTGIFESDTGSFKVHIPKLGLEFKEISYEIGSEETYAYDVHDHKVTSFTTMLSKNVYAVDGKYYEIEIVERNVSKSQLEKELGYKINLED